MLKEQHVVCSCSTLVASTCTAIFALKIVCTRVYYYSYRVKFPGPRLNSKNRYAINMYYVITPLQACKDYARLDVRDLYHALAAIVYPL